MRPGIWGWATLATLAVVCAAYMAFKSLTAEGAEFRDFDVFWVAGRMWNEGLNPYDTPALEGRMLAEVGRQTAVWGYMPHFHVVLGPLALLELETARWIWVALNIFVLIGSSVLLGACLIGRTDVRLALLATGIALVFTLTSQPAIAMVFLGQSRGLLLFGVALFAWGVLSRSRAPVIAGLVILTMKPDLGLGFVACCLADRRHWGPLVIAGALSLGLAGYTFSMTSPDVLAGSFLASVGAYSDYPANSAWYMGGIRHLVWRMADLDIGKAVPAFVAAGLAFAATRHAVAGGASVQRALLAMIVLLSLNFAAFHYNTLLLVVVLVLLLPSVTGAVLALLTLGLLYRGHTVVAISGLGGIEYGDRIFFSLVCLGALLGTAWIFLAARRAEQTGRAP